MTIFKNIFPSLGHCVNNSRVFYLSYVDLHVEFIFLIFVVGQKKSFKPQIKNFLIVAHRRSAPPGSDPSNMLQPTVQLVRKKNCCHSKHLSIGKHYVQYGCNRSKGVLVMKIQKSVRSHYKDFVAPSTAQWVDAKNFFAPKSLFGVPRMH